MELWKYENKEILITFVDGETLEGRAVDYSSAEDNANGIDSICIGDYELYENEIAGIEIIAANRRPTQKAV